MWCEGYCKAVATATFVAKDEMCAGHTNRGPLDKMENVNTMSQEPQRNLSQERKPVHAHNIRVAGLASHDLEGQLLAARRRDDSRAGTAAISTSCPGTQPSNGFRSDKSNRNAAEQRRSPSKERNTVHAHNIRVAGSASQGMEGNLLTAQRVGSSRSETAAILTSCPSDQSSSSPSAGTASGVVGLATTQPSSDATHRKTQGDRFG